MSADGRVISYDRPFGPLPDGFEFVLSDRGYQVLVGPNNVGKSALLQLCFSRWTSANGLDAAALVLPDRQNVLPSTEPGGKALDEHNKQLVQRLNDGPLRYDQGNIAPDIAEFPRLVLGHTDFLAQMNSIAVLMQRLGLPAPVLSGPQNVMFEGVVAGLQGSGLRSLLHVLAPLTDPALTLVLIDEPELSLEPKVQRVLAAVLQEYAADRAIAVSTHSHLFLNREEPHFNHIVQADGEGNAKCTAVANRGQLLDLTFELLGNDTRDLFFPGNYLVTEGASDQVICERVLELLGAKAGDVKVLAAGGIDNVQPTLESVFRSLLPLWVSDSPYAERVVAVVDSTTTKDQRVRELESRLGDRLHVLASDSLEEEFPDELYKRCGRDRDADVQAIHALKQRGNYPDLAQMKREISNAIAAALTKDDDLASLLPAIQGACAQAFGFVRG